MRPVSMVLLGSWLAACGSGSSRPGGGGPGPIAPPETIHREETRIVAPWVGIDAAGVGYLVWSNDANVSFLARHVPGQGWTPTETIPAMVRLDSMAVDEAGVLYAVDYSSAAGQIGLWSYDTAAGWQQLTPLSTARGGVAQLLAAARGVSMVWMHAETTSLEEIWGARYHPDSGWTTPALVNHPPQSTRDIGSMGAAGDADGNVAVIWGERTSDSSALMAANLPAGGNWGEPRVLLTPAITPSGDVAMGAGGRALAAWEDQQMLNVSWLAPQGGFGAPAPAIAAGWEQLAVSLDAAGRAFVSWMDLSDDPTARLVGLKVLWGAAYDPGGGWKAVPRLDRHPDYPDRPASLSVFYSTSTLVGSDGRGAVAATSSTGREMYLIPYRHGAGAGTPRVLDVTDRVLEEQGLPLDGVTVAFGRPLLVANRAGQAIMTWTMLRTGGPGFLRAAAFDL